jgi:hypothetical protein
MTLEELSKMAGFPVTEGKVVSDIARWAYDGSAMIRVVKDLECLNDLRSMIDELLPILDQIINHPTVLKKATEYRDELKSGEKAN